MSVYDVLTRALVPGFVAFTLICLLTPVALRVAVRKGILDRPTGVKRHHRATPYLGGVAIAVGSLVAGCVVSGWSKGAFAIASAGALLAGLGLLDDLRNLRPGPRLAVESVAALTAAAAGARVHLLGNPLDWVITVAWIVVLTNSFNLLDNMDGAATTVATVTAGGLATAAVLEGQILVAGLTSVLCGASLGFLLFNRPPARIFMGDAGSLFLGYLLAVAALALRFPTSNRASGVVAVLLLSSVPLFDTTLVVISRKRANRGISTGGTDHLSHRLRRLGLPVVGVDFVLATAVASGAGLGLMIGHGSIPWAWALALAFPAACALAALLKMSVYAPPAAEPGTIVASRQPLRLETAQRPPRRSALSPFRSRA